MWEAEINKCDTLTDLFLLWKKAHILEENYTETTVIEPVVKGEKVFSGIAREAFIGDGYICEREYKSSLKKVLFILKEANIQKHRNENQLKNPSEDSQVGFYTDYISYGKTNTPRQHEKMGRIAHYILFGYDTTDKERIKTALEKTSFMNINKRGGGNKTDKSKFENYFNKYKDFVNKQISILSPDIIVVIGKMIKTDLLTYKKARIVVLNHTADYFHKTYKPDKYLREFIKKYEGGDE